MRTVDEIVERYKAKIDDPNDDIMGFYREVLAEYIPFDRLADTGAFDTEGLAAWTAEERSRRDAEVLATDEAGAAEAARYLEFAFGKALDHRGISASRSVDKMGAHLWVLGHDLTEFDAAGYAQYGVPKLVVAANLLGVAVPESQAIANMANGDPCRPGCDEGCGR